MCLKKMRLNFLFVVFVTVLCWYFSYSGSYCYAVPTVDETSSILLASDKKSVYNTSRGDGLSSLNTSYYDGITASFYLDGELSAGYLTAIASNVFMHFGVIYPFDLASYEFGLGFIVDAAYSFGFTSWYELQAGGGLILWYASVDIHSDLYKHESSLFRIYFTPKVSNVFHITNKFALNADLLFSAKMYSSKDYEYVKRAKLDVGVGMVYKL